MTIDKFANSWAENAASGDIDSTITDAKIATGYVLKEKPAYQRFNKIQNRTDNKIQELVENVSTNYDGTAPHDVMSTGLYSVTSEGWAFADSDFSAINKLSTSGSITFGMCYVNIDDVQLIAVLTSDEEIELWNPRTTPPSLVDTSDALTDDLPSGSSETWSAQSMCCDGTSLYCTFTDGTPATQEHRIQAWDPSTWDVKSGWPSTGVDLGTGDSTTYPTSKVIVASSSDLAVRRGWETYVSASSDPLIGLFNLSNGTNTDNGAGDSDDVTTLDRLDIASDGLCLYSLSYGQIFTADLGDLTSGSGGTGYPLTVTSVSGLCNISDGIILSVHDNAAGAATETAVMTHNVSDAELDHLILGKNAEGLIGDHWLLKQCRGVTFDGFRVWMYGMVENVDSTWAGSSRVYSEVLVSVDVAKLSKNKIASSQRKSLAQLCDVFVINNAARFALTDWNNEAYDRYPMCFDGRDIWTYGYNLSKPLRLPFAVWRG